MNIVVVANTLCIAGRIDVAVNLYGLVRLDRNQKDLLGLFVGVVCTPSKVAAVINVHNIFVSSVEAAVSTDNAVVVAAGDCAHILCFELWRRAKEQAKACNN